MSEIVITLPDELAQEAKEMGLFSPRLAASIFRTELRRRRVNKLFSAMDNLAEIGDPMSDEEVLDEVRAVRRKRRAKN
jgi:hypothetical protein